VRYASDKFTRDYIIEAMASGEEMTLDEIAERAMAAGYTRKKKCIYQYLHEMELRSEVRRTAPARSMANKYALMIRGGADQSSLGAIPTRRCSNSIEWFIATFWHPPSSN
jgi:hypothetical protein